ncbi:hypothetical protein LCGC14_0941540 [marine sediment metagenome]|uniref:Fibronectin type-III domain-containing protein n=1 Tax=marine sediment metagenome TaxID=412755 RepID=A0A0F9NK00_9ZZZZ
MKYKDKLLTITFFLLPILALNILSPFKQQHFETKSQESSLELSSSTPVWSFNAGNGINVVRISADGEYIVAACINTGNIYFFHKSSNVPLWIYPTGTSYVRSVAISADGSYIVAGHDNNLVYLFHKSSSTPLWNYSTGDYVWEVAISADGNYIAAAGRNNYTYFFHRNSSTPLWSYMIGSEVKKVALSNDGNYLAMVGTWWDTDIYVFNTSNSASPLLWSYTTGSWGMSVDISGNGKYVAAGGYENIAYLFNTLSPDPILNYTVGNGIEDIALSDDGSYLAVPAYDKKLYLFDTNNLSSPLLWESLTGDDAEEVAISADGRRIVVGNQFPEDRVYLFSKEDPNPLWYYTCGHNARTVDMSIDGQYIVAGSDDNNVYLFYEPISPGELILSSDAKNPDLDGNFTLSWSTSLAADNYSVYKNENYITKINGSVTLLDAGITNLTYMISGLELGIYYYKIVAYNELGNSSSNCIKIIVLEGGNFTLTTNAGSPDTNGKFDLIWTTSIGAESYSIYTYYHYITSINGSLTILAYQNATSAYPISALENGIYYYVIVAHNEIGTILSNCLSIIVQNPLFNPPGQFTLSTSANIPDEDGLFSLIWTDSESVDYYKIYTSDQFIPQITNETTFIGQTAISPYLVSANGSGEHYYIIQAHNEYGQTLSNCIKVIVQIPLFDNLPGLFTLSSNADIPDKDGLFSLIWTNSENADYYMIFTSDQFITQINNKTTFIGQTAISPYIISANESREYFYIIEAHNEYGPTLSNCIKIIVQIPIFNNTPGLFTLSSNADIPDEDGLFSLIWTNSENADYYKIYTSDQLISQINNGTTFVGQTPISPYIISANGSREYFYIIEAHNENGQTLSNCVKIIVQIPIFNPPGLFTLSSNADAPDKDGLFSLIWTNSENADYYLIYSSGQLITQINNETTFVGQTTVSSYNVLEVGSGEHYYLVEAYNEYGETLSNCIKIFVQVPRIDNLIPGYPLLFLITIVCIVSILIIYRKYKKL